MIEELREKANEYLKTHETESQQEYGKLMLKVLSRPSEIPEVRSKPIKVMLYSLGYKTKKEMNEAYDKLIKEIKERDNKIYNLVDPDLLENYKSK